MYFIFVCLLPPLKPPLHNDETFVFSDHCSVVSTPLEGFLVYNKRSINRAQQVRRWEKDWRFYGCKEDFGRAGELAACTLWTKVKGPKKSPRKIRPGHLGGSVGTASGFRLGR